MIVLLSAKVACLMYDQVKIKVAGKFFFLLVCSICCFDQEQVSGRV